MESALVKEPAVQADAGTARPAGDERGDWPIRPALFARYADLAALRHPYPVVLTDDDRRAPPFLPLMRIINEALAASAAPGSAGEATRQRVLRLEEAIRRRVAEGGRGALSDLWRDAADALVAEAGEARFGPMDSDFDRVREALAVDGAVVGCDAATPGAVLRHVWRVEHNRRARSFRKKVDGLLLALSDILKADFAKSDDAHSADRLSHTTGATDRDHLDFHALSRMLARRRPEQRLSADRLRRIEWAMLVLRSQRFFEPGRATERGPGMPEPHAWTFDSATEALAALRRRMAETVEFVKALTIAELEVETRYDPAAHDAIIDAFDESDLTDAQLAILPAPLIRLRDGVSGNAELVRAFEALASGLPFKLLIQTDDIVGGVTPEPPEGAFGRGSARLAAMAMGLNDAFVLQVSAAHLTGVAEKLARGMRHDGPALFCVYSGATETVPGVAPYLLAAAATESRMFPSFIYDPSAGPDWARRFDLSPNPQREADCPARPLAFEDGEGQRKVLDTRFCAADFIMADTRYRRFCRPRPVSDRGAGLTPASDWLALAPEKREGIAPEVPGLGPDDRLYRVVLDDKIMGRAQSALQAWKNLRELAGIGNSHVERALAEARAQLASEAPKAAPAAATPRKAEAKPAPEPRAEAASAALAEPRPDADDSAAEADDGLPWIESSRCTSCNECIQINGRLFSYNEDGQAHVADPRAGSFRELVEAAESCQVSIIHPGRPLDPGEPDLAALIERAAPFN